MLRRFWRWLSRLWRKPEPPPAPDPFVREMLEQSQEHLRQWAMAKLRNDIIVSLQAEHSIKSPE